MRKEQLFKEVAELLRHGIKLNLAPNQKHYDFEVDETREYILSELNEMSDPLLELNCIEALKENPEIWPTEVIERIADAMSAERNKEPIEFYVTPK